VLELIAVRAASSRSLQHRRARLSTSSRPIGDRPRRLRDGPVGPHGPSMTNLRPCDPQRAPSGAVAAASRGARGGRGSGSNGHRGARWRVAGGRGTRRL